MEKEQREQNRLLKNTFMFIGAILLGFVLYFVFLNYLNSFDYKGVDFNINKNEVKGMTLYQTSVPVITSGGETRDYNFYLREDPRELEKKVIINDEIVFRKNLILDVTTENLFCGGDWNYFQLQLQNLEIFDIRLFSNNKSIEYEPTQNYMFITINEGNTTEINNVGGNYYEANVSNCEIASVADRLLLEAIVINNEKYSEE